MSTATAFSHIGQIASMRRVHEAFQWLHLHEQQVMRWQVELVSVPAPPFAERARAEWLLARFAELGLADAHLDDAGNVLATLPGGATSALTPDAQPLILLSAHIDTVFPAQTPLEPVLEGHRLTAPGACDNGAGVVALLALAAALLHTGIEPGCSIVFAGNVGEEGEGDLRGMRQIYEHAPWRGQIAAHLVLDGAGHEIAVTGALGSRRFEVVVRGQGGHSWTDAGRPNPVIALCEAIAAMNSASRAPSAIDPVGSRGPSPELVRHGGQLQTDALLPATAPPSVRSTWNVGTIEGGASVNSIPEQARARFDLRSTDQGQLLLLDAELHRAVEAAVLAVNAGSDRRQSLTFSVESIGNRPAGELREGARILALLRGVDRHLHLRTECRVASTDANIPLSLGVEALSIGAGGEGGGIHTRAEWYDARGRDLGLRRVLLLLLALATEPTLPQLRS